MPFNDPLSELPRAHASYGLSGESRDEINLVDLWRIMLRRRWLLAGVWVVMVLLSVIYLLVTPPVYESRAVIKVGHIAGRQITPLPALALELKEGFQVGERGRRRPFVSRLKPEGEDFLMIYAEAGSPRDAQKYLGRVLAQVLEAQGQRYEQAVQLRRASIAVIQEQITNLNEQVGRLSDLVDRGQVDDAVKALLVLQRSGIQAALPALNRQGLELKQELSALNTYKTYVVRQPTLPGERKPQPKHVLMVALVLGGVLGVVTVFFYEFIRRARMLSRSEWSLGSHGAWRGRDLHE